MLIDGPERAELLAEFVAESREHLSEVESQLLEVESSGDELNLPVVNAVFRCVHSIKGAAGMLGFSTITELAHHLESVLNMIRNQVEVPDSAVIDSLLRASDALKELLVDVESSEDVDVTPHIDDLRSILEPGGRGGDDGARRESVAPVEEPQASGGSEASIRVSVGMLDRLMNLAGELVLSRNELMQAIATSDQRMIDSASTRIDRVTSSLQGAIMQTRMQPIGSVLLKCRRVVRDLAHKLGKECRLRVDGKDVELDRAILEMISAPLTHLVRNAMDHGIETPEVREARDKPRAGTVSIRAFQQNGKVHIEISDDGRGIDTERLCRKAVEHGLMGAEEARQLSDREAFQLILLPGLTTAERVTDVSGRGVGMDVVKANLAKLGGLIDIESAPDEGTTITIKLPLTLAIITALLVRSGGQCYAIPQANIREIVRLKVGERDRIHDLGDQQVLSLRGEVIPLISLKDVLEGDGDAGELAERAEGLEPIDIIVVEAGLTYGLIVDWLVDSSEIVVKPLGRHIDSSQELAGAAILGDGQIALILDVAGIARARGLSAVQASPEADDDDEEVRGPALHMILFANERTERFAVTMDAVARIERVRREDVSSVGDIHVYHQGQRSIPVVNLEDVIKARPKAEQARYNLLVYSTRGREVALLVTKILHMKEMVVEFNDRTFVEQGVVGSFVYDDRTTRILDLDELTKRAFPEWSAALGEAEPARCDGPRLLLVEDSTFFRAHVGRFLTQAGYHVTACEDGAVAWERLSAGDDAFDAIVTDIDMPNMDGLELARRVRGNSKLAKLPIIALTSLASETDIQAGQLAGIDDYQIKMDIEMLLNSVERFAGAGVPS